jgi:hypothetical protein
MGEIGWIKAFGYSLRYILYIIIWLIIGGVIAGMGVMIIAESVGVNISFLGTSGITPQVKYNFNALVSGIILIIIGWIVAFLGSMAAYFKIMSKLIRESLPEILQGPPSS